MEEGAQEFTEEGAQHLASHVFSSSSLTTSTINAFSLLLTVQH